MVTVILTNTNCCGYLWCMYQEPVHIRNLELVRLRNELMRRYEELKEQVTRRNRALAEQTSPQKTAVSTGVVG